jgi:NTE family protein
VAGNLIVGGSLEIGRLRERLNLAGPAFSATAPEQMNVVTAGSLFIAADTVLGPLYLGAGLGEGGERALYIFLGRP